MNMPSEDVLNAILTDLVADQVVRALELGYTRKDAVESVKRGIEHGIREYSVRQKEIYGKNRRL